MKRYSVDAGRFSTVTVGPDGYMDYFLSVVGETHQFKLPNKPLTTDIAIRTGFGDFFVGELARRESHGAARFMTASKLHRDTKVLVISAISRAVNNGDEITLRIGAPIDDHVPEVKKQLIELVSGFYKVEINGVLKSFSIREVQVCPEGIVGYMVLCPRKGGIKRFIDIGSRTVNYGTMRNGLFINKESGTLPYGRDTKHIDDETFSHLVTADLSQVWDTFDVETYLLGGGARLCSIYMVRHFPKLLSAAFPQHVNALAFQSL